jgi:anaerobic magnesium-protoporphyrin IX monomethyl ester cyclase
MKVVLIYPSIQNFGWNSLGSHKECIYLNHGLGLIAAVLKEKGIQVSLVDLRECLGWKDFTDKVIAEKGDIYLVSMITLDFEEAKMCGDILHRLGKYSMVGGVHPTIKPDEVAEKTKFNHVFIGEAEKTLPEIIFNLNEQPRVIIGEHPDLDSLPYEDRTIWNMQKILATKHSFYPQPFMNVLSGRGCIYNCSFCQPCARLTFGKFRQRSVGHFMGEIELLLGQYNFNMLNIDDDTFTQKPDYVFEFCERYSKIGRPISCQSRADVICNNPEMIKKMKEVGLEWLTIGFEAGSERILNQYRKGITVEQNLEAGRICKSLGVKVWANYILGAPTETVEEMEATLKMIREINPEHRSPAVFTPFPGTDLYNVCKQNDLIISEDPELLGTRRFVGDKIKGVDYNWIRSHI